MIVQIHGSGFEIERELRKDIHEKMEIAFGRFEGQIAKLNVYLADLNGPKKGVDKSIRIVVDIERQPVIVVEEKGEDWLALLESISDRASHTVAKQFGRLRSRKRRVSMSGDFVGDPIHGNETADQVIERSVIPSN
jgi:putative sigma-54 modulation protein